MSEEEDYEKVINAMKLMQEGMQDAAYEYDVEIVATALSAWFGKVANQADWSLGEALEITAEAFNASKE